MADPIRYYHRAKQTIETEQVYGEAWLRWTYETVPGRATLHLLAKRWLVSAFFGGRMNWRYSAQKILPFIAEYDHR